MKVVINNCHGGFELSDEANRLYIERTGKKFDPHNHTERANPVLVNIVETLGDNACEWYSSPKIVEVPDGVKWHIEEHDGDEWVAENHRKWY